MFFFKFFCSIIGNCVNYTLLITITKSLIISFFSLGFFKRNSQVLFWSSCSSFIFYNVLNSLYVVYLFGSIWIRRARKQKKVDKRKKEDKNIIFYYFSQSIYFKKEINLYNNIFNFSHFLRLFLSKNGPKEFSTTLENRFFVSHIFITNQIEKNVKNIYFSSLFFLFLTN